MNTLQDFKADLFRTLGNPVRIRILEVLEVAGSLSVSEIQHRVGIEPANASQHLSVLRARGVVHASRDGTSVRYAVTDPSIFEFACCCAPHLRTTPCLPDHPPRYRALNPCRRRPHR